MSVVVRTFIAAVFVGGSLTTSAFADEARDSTVPEETPLTDADWDHWSFHKLVRPAVPAVRDAGWCNNPIDRFVLAKLEEAELSPMPVTDRVTLIRRVTFDLTGLPPTPEEIDAFVNDPLPDAYDRLVDRLLASPAYGERWAQHWLDLARFAETDGFEHDKVRESAWQYRDWVIDALNADMPYDEFIRLQLAGDELRPDDQQAEIATKFLLCGPDMPDINLQEERRHSFLNDLTSTVGSALLGLQFGCAQCHDHKYDPISQYDFYRLRAVFDPAIELRKNKSIERLRESDEVPASYLMVRGDFRRPGPKVSAAFPRVANPWQASISAPSDEADTTLRRTTFARWVTRDDHPLALRVIVNRLWQHHFGEGLARDPSDFGIMGDSPWNPELLEWLATELPRRGWSLKQMHKLLVTSAAYRVASRPVNPAWSVADAKRAADVWNKLREKDSDNRWLGRRARRRLEGEAIRDAMLAASNNLSQRRGGQGVRPPLPKELLVTLLRDQWPVTENADDHRRRSVYLFVRRNLRYPMFDVFDKPDTNLSCARRNRSTIAPQALMLLNSEFSLEAAQELSAYMYEQAGGNRRQQIEYAYRCTLGRKPNAVELNAAEEFLVEAIAESRRTDPTNPPEADALTDLCLTLFNLNEFIYVD